MTRNEILAQFANDRAALLALPANGVVLYNRKTKLAMKLPDGDADRAHVVGLVHATVFASADALPHNRNRVPGLDRTYSDGNGTPFQRTTMALAKQMAIAELDRVTATIEALPE